MQHGPIVSGVESGTHRIHRSLPTVVESKRAGGDWICGVCFGAGAFAGAFAGAAGAFAWRRWHRNNGAAALAFASSALALIASSERLGRVRMGLFLPEFFTRPCVST